MALELSAVFQLAQICLLFLLVTRNKYAKAVQATKLQGQESLTNYSELLVFIMFTCINLPCHFAMSSCHYIYGLKWMNFLCRESLKNFHVLQSSLSCSFTCTSWAVLITCPHMVMDHCAAHFVCVCVYTR